jgi:hypothetical protein
VSTLAATDTTEGKRFRLFSKKDKPQVTYYAPYKDPKRHPINALMMWARTQGWKFIFGALIGVFAFAGVYWLATQTNHPVHDWWHNTVPNDDVRHNDRALFEGVCGALVGFAMAWNHYKKKFAKAPKGLNKLMMKIGIPVPNDGKTIKGWQLVLAPFLWIAATAFALYCIGKIGGFFGYGIGDTASSTTVFSSTDPGFAGLVEKNVNAFVGDLPLKIQGFVAGRAGIIVIQGVIDDVQLWFAEQKACADTSLDKLQAQLKRVRINVSLDTLQKVVKRLQWWGYPPPYLARVTESRRNITVVLKKRSVWAPRLFKSGAVMLVLLAILGFCAINFDLPHVQDAAAAQVSTAR